MPKSKIKIGDRVAGVFGGTREKGKVISVYEHDGNYRCVVRFDDGREGVFFDFELTAPADDSSEGREGK